MSNTSNGMACMDSHTHIHSRTQMTHLNYHLPDLFSLSVYSLLIFPQVISYQVCYVYVTYGFGFGIGGQGYQQNLNHVTLSKSFNSIWCRSSSTEMHMQSNTSQTRGATLKLFECSF